jgi:hypothetical protein
MHVFQVEAQLLRNLMPELVIRPGITLAARVAEKTALRSGVITLAGVRLQAQLPEQVREGDTLRLQVAEASRDRLVMRLVGESGQAQQQVSQQPPVPVPLPDGGAAWLRVDEREAEGGSEGEEASVALTYQSPSLGPLGLRLGLTPGAITVQVRAAQGEPLSLARSRAEALRSALAQATGRNATVHVLPRRDPIDVYG